MTDRELLEKCLAHLDRMIDRYVPINTGDRLLAKTIRAHLNESPEPRK